MAVTACEEDLLTMQFVFRCRQWKFDCASGVEEALSFVRRNPLLVIISEPELTEREWRRLLSLFIAEGHPSALIVFRQSADTRLWSELLHLGEDEVLLQRFDKEEIVRTVCLAWQRWKDSWMRSKTRSRAGRILVRPRRAVGCVPPRATDASIRPHVARPPDRSGH
jgi:DNA-binding NarL/FixJ family response regulator